MIRRMFRVIGGFVAFLTYHALILPLVIMLLSFFRVYRVQVQENRVRGFGVRQRS